jgi:hypothetical protein
MKRPPRVARREALRFGRERRRPAAFFASLGLIPNFKFQIPEKNPRRIAFNLEFGIRNLEFHCCAPKEPAGRRRSGPQRV